MAGREQEPQHHPSYDQLTFADFETETNETALFNCEVVTPPIYKQEGKSYVWHCRVAAPPDMFNPDHQDEYELHAKHYAKEAHSKRLKPGDVLHVTGVPWTQTVTLQSGETTVINHLNVSNIERPKKHKPPSPGGNIKNWWTE